MVAGKRKILSTVITVGAIVGTMVLGDKLNISEELVKFTIGALGAADGSYIVSNLLSKKISNGGKNNE